MIKNILAYIFAAALIFFGVQKFGAENIIFMTIAEKSGIALFEPYVRILTGVLEITAGLLLILPKSRGFGVALGTAVVSGAIVFHLSPWLGINTPMEAGGEEGPVLFMMAIGIFVLALVNLVLNKDDLPIIGSK